MRLGLVLGGLLLALPAAARTEPPTPLKPKPLSSTASTTWEEAQFVRADREGNVFFLRGSKLEVYPLTKSGQLGPPARLQATGAMPSFVLDAAMDPSGENWLLLADGHVRLFGADREKDLPALQDQPWGVGFLRGSPVLALVPRPVEGRKGNPPWLVRAGTSEWEQLVDFSAAYSGDPLELSRRNDIIGNSAVFLAGDRQGRLWTARRYAYRLEKFSEGGKRLQEIKVGDGKFQREGDDHPVPVTLPVGDSKPESDSVTRPERKGTFRPFTGRPTVLDLTEARDRNLYFLVQTQSGALAIDRYNPSADLLERRELTLSVQGRMTIAAGKDALYLAAWNGDAGRWRIAWDELDKAKGWSELVQSSH